MEYTWHLFQAGGIVMYPLMAFLIASWTIGRERIRTFRSFNEEVRKLAKVVYTAQNSGNWEELLEGVKSQGGHIGQFLYPILSTAQNYQGLENRLQDIIGHSDVKLKKGLNWLSMMVTMAPLLGLLGTVIGMIRSFAAVGGEIGAPTVITGGVSAALVATAMGLTVAVMALMFHSYCASMVNSFIAQLEQYMGNILDVYNRSHKL